MMDKNSLPYDAAVNRTAPVAVSFDVILSRINDSRAQVLGFTNRVYAMKRLMHGSDPTPLSTSGQPVVESPPPSNIMTATSALNDALTELNVALESLAS